MSKTFPLHADTVGSYLRSEPLKAARADFAAGKMSREQLTQIEDQEIEKLVQAQLATGIQVLTDGEFRRSWWHIDFLENLNGMEDFILEQVFYEAGCHYLQFDDVYWGTLCNHYDKPDFAENKRYALKNIQDILSVKPADMTITTHVCRGNYKSSYLLTGAYDPVAEDLFGKTAYDGYFLEYDNERSSGFEPLKHFQNNLHKGRVVLGLITSKFPELEDKAAIKTRIAEAANYVPLEQLALSPQCGFASTEEGNIMSEAEQWAKVRLVEEIAKEVWGED